MPACVVIGAGTANDRVVVRAEQQNLALTCISLTCGGLRSEFRKMVFEPLDGVAQRAPFINCCAPERLGDEKIALTDFAGKPLDMCSKTVHEVLIFAAHVRSHR